MVAEYIKMAKEKHVPVDGSYPKKPESSKSLHKWLTENKIPVDFAAAKLYAMSGGIKGYYYYDEEDVREMTNEELNELNALIESEQVKKTAAKSDTKKKSTSKFNPDRIPDNVEQLMVFAFDCESSGFSPEWDDMLQLSVVGCKGLCFDTFLHPRKKRSWPKTEPVHHITPAMVANAPYPEEIKERIQKWFNKANIIVGHNVSFDVRFMKSTFGSDFVIDDAKIIDTMHMLKYLHPELDHHKLADAVAIYGTPEIKAEYAKGAHNALFDTKATYQVFIAMCREIIARRNAA